MSDGTAGACALPVDRGNGGGIHDFQLGNLLTAAAERERTEPSWVELVGLADP